jgi:hypothetical protein
MRSACPSKNQNYPRFAAEYCRLYDEAIALFTSFAW